MIKINNKFYIESQNIRVFPCAYRGHYDSTNPKVFDPEARATTEANFTNTFHKLSYNKESYVVAWVPDSGTGATGTGTLKCVIGGYYFEIYNHKIRDFFYPDKGDPEGPYYLCIKTDSVSLGTSDPDETDARTTTVLSSFANATNYLDIYDATQKQYAFTGLLVSTTGTGTTASLAPFIATVKYIEAGFSGMVPITDQYYLNAENEFVEAKGAALKDGTQLYMKIYEYKIDPTKLPITNLLDVGSGNYSIRMLEDGTGSGTNTTVARGDYSVALGLSTAATGKASTALGNNTEASAEGAFAAGNNTKASGEGTVALGSDTTASGTNAIALGDTTTASGANAIALGSNTKAETANQVVIGTYNVKDDNQAFIIANGDATAGSNKFTVSKTGDVKALGTLETKGSIKATGDSNNDLELGTSAEGSSGSIKVYGGAEDEVVFTVENTGNTTIAGDTVITKDTQSDNTTSGALKVSGGVGVAKNLNVGGTTNITGKTTLGDALEVTGATTLNSTLNISSNTVIGGTATITGATTINNNITVTGTTNLTGNATLKNDLIVEKNASVGGETTLTGKVKVNDTTQASKTASETTAALVVDGGEVIGNNLIINGTTESTSVTTGALVVGGGVGIGSKLCVGNDTSIGGNVNLSKNLVLTGGTATHSVTIGHKNQAVTDDKSAGSLTIYTTGGNIGFRVDEAGNSSLFNRLTINSETEASGETRLLIGGNATVKGTLTAQSLNLTDTGSIQNGDIKATNIEAATELKAKELTLKNDEGNEFVKVDTAQCNINTSQILLKVTGENEAATVDGQFKSTGYTTLANKVKIDANGDITGINTLEATGKIKAQAFNAQSDARKKTNIQDYQCKNSILDLPIKSFEYLNDDSHATYIGCIAQDLQKICPELIDTDVDGFLSIQETKLIYLLLEEVKKLKTRIETLEGV